MQLHFANMSEQEPVIELTPKNPFSWRIFVAFVGAWVVVLGLAYFLKSGMIRILLPLIGLVFLVYVVVCTIYLIKHRK